MPRLTAKDFAPELLELYDYYAHGKINRRDFLDRGGVVHFGWFDRQRAPRRPEPELCARRAG